MFYSTWLLAAAVAGWAAGEITGTDGFGTGADLLLGITGAFVVRWSLENMGIFLANVYLLLFSIWEAAALPAIYEARDQAPQAIEDAIAAPKQLACDLPWSRRAWFIPTGMGARFPAR